MSTFQCTRKGIVDGKAPVEHKARGKCLLEPSFCAVSRSWEPWRDTSRAITCPELAEEMEGGGAQAPGVRGSIPAATTLSEVKANSAGTASSLHEHRAAAGCGRGTQRGKSQKEKNLLYHLLPLKLCQKTGFVCVCFPKDTKPLHAAESSQQNYFCFNIFLEACGALTPVPQSKVRALLQNLWSIFSNQCPISAMGNHCLKVQIPFFISVTTDMVAAHLIKEPIFPQLSVKASHRCFISECISTWGSKPKSWFLT